MIDTTLDGLLVRLSVTDTAEDSAFHPFFNAVDADLVLISADELKFGVHKKTMADKSFVFRDMFEVGEAGDGVAEVPMVEPSEVLEPVLSHCYGRSVAANFAYLAEPWKVLRTLEKFDITFSLSSIATNLSERVVEQRKNPEILVRNYLFASHKPERDDFTGLFGHRNLLGRRGRRGGTYNKDFKRHMPELNNVEKAVEHLLDSGLAWDTLAPAFARAAEEGWTDDGKFEALLERRARILQTARERIEKNELAMLITKYKCDPYVPRSSIDYVVKSWRDSAHLTSTLAFKEYQALLPPRTDYHDVFLWRPLYDAIKSLPTKIRRSVA